MAPEPAALTCEMQRAAHFKGCLPFLNLGQCQPGECFLSRFYYLNPFFPHGLKMLVIKC